MTQIPDEYDVEAAERATLEAMADDDLTPAVETFKALTDPLRLAVLRLLAERELCVCVLVDVLGVEYSNLSYHLKVLRTAGLVSHERDGNFAEYALTARGREMARLVASVVADSGPVQG